MSIKTKFEKLPYRDKILLYLIVIMVYAFIYIYYVELKNLFSAPFVQNNYSHVSMKKNHESLVNNQRKLSDVELVYYFSKYSQKYKIRLKETKLNRQTINIVIEGTLSNMINFLFVVLHNFKLEQLEINKKTKDISISIIFNTELFYESSIHKHNINLLSNPFQNIKDDTETLSFPIRVCAIVKDEVLIDDIWLQKNDIIKEYQIIKINKDTVHLKNLKTKQMWGSV